MTEHIAGKVVVITGASSGLGEAAARHLSALGASVSLGARRIERLNLFARAVAFAIAQTEDIDINEILYRPTRQEY
jgi:NADP-dependent 3-hydroxy acid dehydrogenase YdfG